MPRREAPGKSRVLLMAHVPKAPSPSLLTAAWPLSSGWPTSALPALGQHFRGRAAELRAPHAPLCDRRTTQADSSQTFFHKPLVNIPTSPPVALLQKCSGSEHRSAASLPSAWASGPVAEGG